MDAEPDLEIDHNRPLSPRTREIRRDTPADVLMTPAGSKTDENVDSHRSGSLGGAASVTTVTMDEEHKGSLTTTTEDGGDESDLEDSDTPWTRTLVVLKRRMGIA